MKEIDKQTPGHLPDPVERLVREKWIAEGKTGLIDNTPGGETCQAQNR